MVELLETARRAARAGAEVLRRSFGDERLQIETKAKNDFVTSADRASEAAVVAEIVRRHPGHRILAEEGSSNPAADGIHEWVIDPLDGTTNFLQGLPVFAVSVACRRGLEVLAGVVIDPLRGDEFAAERGAGAYLGDRRLAASRRPGLDGAFLATGYPFRAQAALDLYLAVFRRVFHRARAIRRCGAAALDLANCAAGVYDGFFEFRLSPWDIAAGALLLTEAGGAISDLGGGERYWTGGNVLAGGALVHRALVDEISPLASEEELDRLVPSG
jgi:myo-inositol-1(or 4)-monophosphatase